MSYNIVRSINTKKKTITCACNNVYPKTFETTSFVDSDQITTEEFIKRCLVDFIDGEFHSSGDSCWKFNYAIDSFETKQPELAEKIHERRWDNYDYKTKTYKFTKEETQEAEKQLQEELYKYYLEAENSPRGKFILYWPERNVYLTGLTKYGRISYDYEECDAKVFRSKLEAYTYGRKVKDYMTFEVKALS